MNSPALQQPDADALAHSEALLAYLADRIAAAGGAIPFSRYMEMALYAPGLGYYIAGTAKFGEAGDFITAPERSTLFGSTLARSVGPVLAQLDGPRVVFEYGAGSGALAAPLLEALARADQAPDEYWILEVSPELRARQRERIGGLPDDLARRVRWLDKLPERPWNGVVVANEVLDALPVERFRVTPSAGVEGLWVRIGDVGLEAYWDRPTQELKQAAARLLPSLSAPVAPGYVSELCLGIPAFIFTLAATLTRGMALLSDYGGSRREVYHPERRDGTLLCHRRHRAHDDPFSFPGLTDITAWVDFTAVAEAAVEAGFNVAGYTTQAHFLLDCGLADELEASMAADPKTAPQRAAEVRALTLPGEMGERFKFMALARDLPLAPAGFALRDLTAGL